MERETERQDERKNPVRRRQRGRGGSFRASGALPTYPPPPPRRRRGFPTKGESHFHLNKGYHCTQGAPALRAAVLIKAPLGHYGSAVTSYNSHILVTKTAS